MIQLPAMTIHGPVWTPGQTTIKLLCSASLV